MSTVTVSYNNGLWTPDSSLNGFYTPATTTSKTLILSQIPTVTRSSASLSTSSSSTDTSESSSASSISSSSSSLASASHASQTASQSAVPAAYAPNNIKTIVPLLIAGAVILAVGVAGFLYARRRKRRGLPSPFSPSSWFNKNDDGTNEKLLCRRYDSNKPFTDFRVDPNSMQESTPRLDGDPAWNWGATPHKIGRVKPPLEDDHEDEKDVTFKEEDLNAYLAEARTAYNPREGQELVQAQDSGLGRRLSKLYSSISIKSNRSRLGYNSSIKSNRRVDEYGQLQDEESIYSPQTVYDAATPPRTFAFANFGTPDTPGIQAPPMLQRNTTSVTRSLKRWQLSDNPVPSSTTTTPQRFSRYQVVTNDSPTSNKQTRTPSALQPAKAQKQTSQTPLSPPLAPHLFYSQSQDSPSSIIGVSSMSLSEAAASLAFPRAYDDQEMMTNRRDPADPFTSYSSASPRRLKTKKSSSNTIRDSMDVISGPKPRIRSVKSPKTGAEDDALMDQVRQALKARPPLPQLPGTEHLNSSLMQSTSQFGGKSPSVDSLRNLFEDIGRTLK